MADLDSKGTDAPEKKKGGVVKWLILLVLLVVLCAGGFFAYQEFVVKKGGSQNATTQEETAEAEEEAGGEGQQPQMFSMPPFVVNLADPLGRRYLKMSLDIEVKNQAALEKTEKALPRIKDSLLLLLSSKSYGDLSSMENKIALKTEILSRLGQILGSGKVVNVYFTEFIVQ